MQLEKAITLGENMNLLVGDLTVPTKLQELLPEGRLLVSHPTLRMVPVLILPDQTIYFTFYRPDGLYSFSAILEERRIQDGLRMCVFRVTSEIGRAQRRNGYRLAVSLDMSFEVTDPDREPGEPVVQVRTHSVNLSEKGALFTSQVPLECGTRLLLRLRLGTSDTVTLDAEVVRCQPPEHPDDPWVIAVQFCAAGAQDHIGRYVFKRQIMQHIKETE